MKFEDLEIIDPILKALKDKNYTEPTSIQAKAIPLVLKGKDVLGCAQTGTGKTAAFSIPTIQHIHKRDNGKGKPTMRALIVTPTRELAIQIDESIRDYGKYTDIRHTVIFGGVNQRRQVEKLKRGVHVLVATPGRLLDLINQGYIDLSTIKVFILDEADRMLDMGFINDIKKLIAMLPEKRQSLFFSATMPDNIVKLSRQILKSPIKVEVTPVSSTAETIKQYVYYTNRTSKKDLLLHILKDRDIGQVLLFARTKRGADKIAYFLKKCRISAAAIHGDKAQNQRQRSLKAFKEGQIRVLVATDIAARGIDIEKLKYVINYEIPNVPETYVHRIGRSGRAGEDGTSISISEPEENAHIRSIEKLIKQRIEVIKDHPFPQTDKPMTEREKKEWNKEKQRRKMEFIKKKREAKLNPKSSKKRGGSKGGYKKNNSNNSSKPKNQNRRKKY